MTTPNTAADQLPRGRENDYVMFSTLRPGVRVHRYDPETDKPFAWSLYALNLIRTGEGEWLIDVKPDEHSGPLVKVEIDDAAAVAFLDRFAVLLIDPPARGTYRLSELPTT